MQAEKDTLSYQLKMRPGTTSRDVSDASLASVLASYELSKSQYFGHDVHPEREAISFYLANHAVSVARKKVGHDDPLGEWLPIVRDYQTAVSHSATRMFYYILLICTRESRHTFSGMDWDYLRQRYGKELADFIKSIRNSSSSGAIHSLLSKKPKGTLGRYTSMLVHIFMNGSFSSGYGGEAWGAVAKVLNSFVHGELTAELLLDTAFTLCHNNGPIFNKGILYNNASQQILERILDVQRSGQIPQLVADKVCNHVQSSHLGLQQKVEKLDPTFGGYVDWYKVEALGALGSYGMLKQQQVEKHGQPAHLAEIQKLADAKKAAKKAAQAAKVAADELKKKQAQEAHDALWFKVMPGIEVKKVQVREAA